MIKEQELLEGSDEFISEYKKLSAEKNQLIADKSLPEWVITPGYQMLKSKYLDKGESLKDRFRCIAKTAAKYMPSDKEVWESKFFDLLWSGTLSASTPILSSMGKSKGCPVSCASSVVGDSIYDFYSSQLEAAVLSKNGFGTSSYLGYIRPRGSEIKGSKGSASGILPVFKAFVQVSRDVSQGSVRRGAWAGYIPIDHDDFYEVWHYIHKHPDDCNVGWTISDEFVKKLDSGDKEATERFKDVLYLRMVSGKGYLWFVDKVNRLLPEWYKVSNLYNRGSNLCNEVVPVVKEDETFTCILSSINALHSDKILIEGDDTIFNSFVFLHCVAHNFIDIAKDITGLEKAVTYTIRNFSLGLGVLGFHSYLQDKMIPLESLEAHLFNIQLFKKIDSETKRASTFLAELFGEAPICKGYGYANALRIAVAPNLSSALICGGVSQGAEPIYKNAYIQHTASGKVTRVNPKLLSIMKERLDSTLIEGEVNSIIDNSGSVKDVHWLSDHEKQVFKTAFEIDQRTLIRLANERQKYIDQGQSLNLFFSANEDEEYIAKVHKEAITSEYIKGLYYVRSETGVSVSKNGCVACEG